MLAAGVDSSTQSCKLQLRDVDSGALVWFGANPHPPAVPPCSEQHPDDWWRALHPLLDQAWAHAAGTVTAVAVAAQQHALVPLGPGDRVLAPAKLWNDTEAAPDAADLVARLGGPAASAARCGSVIGPAFTAAKVAWLARCRPEVRAEVTRVCLPHDWLTLRLSGELVTDAGDASGTGYYSPAAGTWAPGVLGALGLGLDALPQLLGPRRAAGTIGGVTVAPGTGDNMAAALALCLAPGDVALSLGTSGTVCSVAAAPTADPTGAVCGFADATGRYLPLVCTLNATKVTDTVARLLGWDLPTFDRAALGAPPGAGGCVLVPYLDGERTPARPGASGVLSGLRTTTEPNQLARAAVEGVVCGLLDGLDALAAAVDDVGGRLVLVGGGARSPAFRRVVADLTQRPVTVPDEAELVAAGACVLAAALAADADPIEVARTWDLGRGGVVEPDPTVDAAAVRQAYGAARRATTGE